jgi:uroporphyrin-III C-methyltransferase
MGVTHTAAIAQALIEGGLAPDTPAAAISAAHTPQQRQVRATLGTLASVLAAQAVKSPAILVIGEVAALGAGAWMAVDVGASASTGAGAAREVA